MLSKDQEVLMSNIIKKNTLPMHESEFRGLTIFDNENYKMTFGDAYSTLFNKHDGFFLRFGENTAQDPQLSQYGPEIADIEITTSCDGIMDKGPCSFCYKSNTAKGKYMTIDEFRHILRVLPPTVSQIAFGVDAKAKSNPDMMEILKATRDVGIVPNITVADLDFDTAKQLVSLCGAIAVSCYDIPLCIKNVNMLSDLGMTQVNIHFMLAAETVPMLEQLIGAIEANKLPGLNALVLLALKPKGRGKHFTPVSQETFDSLIKRMSTWKHKIGFDSCSYCKFVKAIEQSNMISEIKRRMLIMTAEPCESTLFSAYINVDGQFFPCSFMEEVAEPQNVYTCNSKGDFIDMIWNSEITEEWRFKIQEAREKRGCCIYDI